MFDSDFFSDELQSVVTLLKEDAAVAAEDVCEIRRMADEFNYWIERTAGITIDHAGPVFTSDYFDREISEQCKPLGALGHEAVCRLESMYADESRTYHAAQRLTSADRDSGLELTDDLDQTFSTARLAIETLHPIFKECADSVRLIAYPHRTSPHEVAFMDLVRRLEKLLRPGRGP